MDNLGHFYESGKGVPKDFAKAKLWYEKAATLGLARSWTSIGLLYEYGYGVPVDYVEDP